MLPPKYIKEIEKYAEKKKLTEKKKQKIIEKIESLYKRFVYDPEEPIGIVTAQSLSEPATQMTMRTYHFAGTAGIQVTLGLPRMIEIFDARKEPKTPTMTIYLKKDYQDIEKVKRVAEEIKEIKMKDIVLSTTIDLTELWIKCKLDTNKMKEYNIDIEKLPKKIRIRGIETKIENNNILKVVYKKDDIRGLYKLKYSLLESHIKGIKGVSQVVVNKEQDEWVISTLGSNLKKVFNIEGIDPTRTTCNNIFEIYDVLGIEAARNTIVEQAKFTMEEQGLDVDIRYIMLLADLMTVDGEIKAIGRYGISGQKTSVLVRASFEETKKHFVNASVKGERDKLKGAIENIMMNQVAPIGTGAFELVGSIPKTKKAEKTKSEKPKKTEKTKSKKAKKAESKKKTKTKKS